MADSDRGGLLPILVQPGARKTEVVGLQGYELRIRVAAPSREGKANRELLSFLAKELDVRGSRVELRSGAASRHKIVAISGMSREEVTSRLLGRIGVE